MEQKINLNEIQKFGGLIRKGGFLKLKKKYFVIDWEEDIEFEVTSEEEQEKLMHYLNDHMKMT